MLWELSHYPLLKDSLDALDHSCSLPGWQQSVTVAAAATKKCIAAGLPFSERFEGLSGLPCLVLLL
jgi:hypothetical protein